MYRDAYPSDRSFEDTYPSAGYVPDPHAIGDADDVDESLAQSRRGDQDDNHEAVWARHFRQFAYAAAPLAPPRPARLRPVRSRPLRRAAPLLLLLSAATVPAIAVMALAGRSTTEDARPALQMIVGYALKPSHPGALREGALSANALRESATPAPVTRHAWMLDPSPVMGDQAATMEDSAPLEPAFPAAPMQVAEAVEALVPLPAKYERAPLLRPQPAETRQQIAQIVPLPQPRPADLMPARAPAVRIAMVGRALSNRAPAERTLAERTLAAPATTRSIPTGPQRLVERPETTRRDLPSTQSVFRAALPGRALDGRGGESALAYAGTNDEAIDASPRARLGLSPNPASGQTAIYDISAQRVYLPSGRVLEAHSGKGPYMDDPRYVHLRMRGATPPGTYMLTERERPYHGVRALRMTPVGGSAAIHGRDGILAHTYMLRQRGASHGCVVFADYRAFLNAYLSGEIRQIKVVSGAKGDALPSVASRVGGWFGRWASAD